MMDQSEAFQAAVKLVLLDEGRMNNHPVSDPDGGLTNFGFAQKQNPDIDVTKLTVETATERYRTHYWLAGRCDLMPWPVSFLVFDADVNQGLGAGPRILQEALRVNIDGHIGPVTLKAIAANDPWELTARFIAKRAIHYTKLGNFPANGEGWFYRLAKNGLAAGRVTA